MADYTFMRSGLVGERPAPAQPAQMLLNVMRLLLKHAVRSAARHAATCGRNIITPRDMCAGLKYEATCFFQRDNLEQELLEMLEESDTEEEGDAIETALEEGGAYTIEFQEGTEDDRAFHSKVREIEESWAEWQPDDVAQLLIKKAIDAVPLGQSAVEERAA